MKSGRYHEEGGEQAAALAPVRLLETIRGARVAGGEGQSHRQTAAVGRAVNPGAASL